MQFLSGLGTYVLPFLIILTVLVFVHELGHFWVARRYGVRVEVFSVGFGPELFGRTDRKGTRWRFSLLPLGGYVRMMGDGDVASVTKGSVAESERQYSLFAKPVGQRAAISVAGPLANFLFAIIILAVLFATAGRPFTPPTADQVVEDGAAAAAGIAASDRFLTVDGRPVERFEELQRVVQESPGRPLAVEVRRGEQVIALTVTPRSSEITDRFGNTRVIGLLGVRSLKMETRRDDPFTAIWHAGTETVNLTVGTLRALGQIIAGTRGSDELGGPLRIAQMSGEVAQGGIVASLWFMAVLSINLGLINLLPVPVLDGGQLVFYAAEALRGRPLGDKAQEWAAMVGLALVLALMVFATWNDLVHLKVVDFIGRLFT
ncbi:MAG: RIP metalloprotease RseP [Alphaproteobacteria bacterium]|nr:RIP metalloprotease RseP [Alphaproteobacteria bacterium]